MDIIRPTAMINNICQNLATILLRSDTSAVRFFLYSSAMIWSLLTLLAPTIHWSILYNIAVSSGNVILSTMVTGFPYISLLYGGLSLVHLLCKRKNRNLEIFGSVVGVFIWTTGLSVDVVIHSMFSTGIFELEVPVITTTILSWWVLGRDLAKGIK